MLEYEWGTHLLSGDDPSDNHQSHFYNPFTDPTHLLTQNPAQITTSSFQTPQFNYNLHYDPTQLLGLGPDPAQYLMVPKPEPEFATRIGLNLGGRTYFSSAESEFVNRLYRRSRPESGSGNIARCQAEGCFADLTHAKHYHRRHKVCEFHSKAASVVVVAAAGVTQRFCQQCSRFHLLTEFDNGKRSCRKRLADHNRRRRKSNNQTNANQEQQQQQQQTPNSHSDNALLDSPSDNLTRSPQDSGTQSPSSVTVAISPQRFSLDCFSQRSYQAAATSSPPTSSLFFSNG